MLLLWGQTLCTEFCESVLQPFQGLHIVVEGFVVGFVR